MITFVLAVCGNVDYIYTFPLSPPSRAAWIEIETVTALKAEREQSPPSRAAWIEIANHCGSDADCSSPPSRAAWIEINIWSSKSQVFLSPPSRAAWIEMIVTVPSAAACVVAAFTGGVD